MSHLYSAPRNIGPDLLQPAALTSYTEDRSTRNWWAVGLELLEPSFLSGPGRMKTGTDSHPTRPQADHNVPTRRLMPFGSLPSLSPDAMCSVIVPLKHNASRDKRPPPWLR